jgi:hypothetical protein
MAEEKAWIIGVENLITWYENMADHMGSACYSIWSGKDLRFSYDGDSVEEGADLLRTNLEMASNLKNSSLMCIRLHKEVGGKGVVTNKTDYSASIHFRCVHQLEDAHAASNLNYRSALDGIRELKDQIAGLRDEKPKGWLGYLEPMLENPETQAVLVGTVGNIISGILGKFLPGAGQAPQPAQVPQVIAAQPAMMAGVDDEDKLDQDLERLERHDKNIAQDLGKLADLADRDPKLFELLINQLRTM